MFESQWIWNERGQVQQHYLFNMVLTYSWIKYNNKNIGHTNTHIQIQIYARIHIYLYIIYIWYEACIEYVCVYIYYLQYVISTS